jgi:hypothetical protein
VEAAGSETVTVAELLDAFGRRAYGPLLFVLGLVMLTPVGAIPGAPLVATVLVLLLMGQSLLREGAPWIPSGLRRIRIDSGRMRASLKRAERWVVWLDRVSRPRLPGLLAPPFIYIWSLCCIAIALTMLPLGFVPFGVAIPSLSLAFIGLGLMNSDGAAVIAGLAIAAAAAWLGTETLAAAVR